MLYLNRKALPLQPWPAEADVCEPGHGVKNLPSRWVGLTAAPTRVLNLGWTWIVQEAWTEM